MSNRKKLFVLSIAVIMLCISLVSCSSCERAAKSWDSEFGGLNRIVNVYDYEGDLIATYEGNLDVQENDSKVLFDLNGKRYVYYNAVVEIIEK
jgi:uncharacterized lipoprotein YehR (DUF1307 family)